MYRQNAEIYSFYPPLNLYRFFIGCVLFSFFFVFALPLFCVENAAFRFLQSDKNDRVQNIVSSFFFVSSIWFCFIGEILKCEN